MYDYIYIYVIKSKLKIPHKLLQFQVPINLFQMGSKVSILIHSFVTFAQKKILCNFFCLPNRQKTGMWYVCYAFPSL